MHPCILLPDDPGPYIHYRTAVESAGGTLLCSRDCAALETCQGLLLPGGGDLDPGRYGQENHGSRAIEPEREALEFALLKRCLRERTPVLGICRGMQLLNVFLGGTLQQDLPGHGTVQGMDRLHWVQNAEPFRHLWGPRSLVNSAHHQAVDRLGAGLLPLQTAPDGTIEAVLHRDLPLLGLQWHPERLDPALPLAPQGQSLFRCFLQLCQTKPGPEINFLNFFQETLDRTRFSCYLN